MAPRLVACVGSFPRAGLLGSTRKEAMTAAPYSDTAGHSAACALCRTNLQRQCQVFLRLAQPYLCAEDAQYGATLRGDVCHSQRRRPARTDLNKQKTCYHLVAPGSFVVTHRGPRARPWMTKT